jgi:outer membrane protein OmpA-like peptidoglycan-associated protein
VIVRGKHAERIQHRNQQLSDKQAEQPKFQAARAGEALVYSATVPFQQWIAGAALVMESGSWGCNASETYPEQLLADNILAPATITTIAAATATVLPSYSRTIGDTLASIFSFIYPEAQWKDGEPIYDEDREEALLVYYPIGKHNIQADFKDNRKTLNNLLAVINTILTAPDSEITRISIAGFSSPEGSFARNDRLAWERAVSVKEYIVKNTKIKSDAIHLYNGSEDWQGLRALVAASDLYDKAEILRIIDTVPLFSADGRRKERLQQLKKLNGGVSYRYMSAYFFPQLRNSAFIRVYYNNK